MHFISLMGGKTMLSKIDKKFLSNGAWLYLLQFFNTVIPLITLPYITRILDKSDYGTFSFSLNIISYLQVIIEFGFGMSATRKAVIIKEKNENISELFFSVFYSRIFLFLICLLISCIYVILYNQDYKIYISYCILMLCLIGNIFQANWLFQGFQDMKYISLINIFGRIISVTFTFLFVRSSKDLFLYCVFYSISPFLTGILGFFLSMKKYKVSFLKVDWNRILQEIKDGFLVFTTQFSSKIFNSLGITFLGVFVSTSAVAEFSAMQKFSSLIVLFWMPISQILYPKSTEKFSHSFIDGLVFIRKTSKVILPFFFLIILMILLFSKKIVYIVYGEAYADSYYLLYPLLIWVFVAIINNLLGVQILLSSGHDKEYSTSFQISVIVTILLNYILTILYKVNGAAFAPLFSELVLMILLLVHIYKIFKKREIL